MADLPTPDSPDRGAADVLVLGASGFLGSHIVRQLVARGRRVRAFARRSSDCRLTADLDVERVYGDIADAASLEAAMQGIDTVYHCIVNTKAWLRDPTPLYAINVFGLQRALATAETAGVRRFVLTSSFATIAPRADGVSDESDEFGDDLSSLPAYIRCRIEAERRFFAFIRNSRLQGVAGCIANTYGAGDLLPTPQGGLVREASRGRMPFYWDGGCESVGIEDAAEGMLLIGERGHSGERYILSERWISWHELFRFAAECNGRMPRFVRFPTRLMRSSARVAEAVARPLGIENKFNLDAIRCSNELALCSSEKVRQLGWAPRPVWEAVEAAVDYFNAAGRSGSSAVSGLATQPR